MTNANAFTEFFKGVCDFNQLFATQRRNIEALSEANQVVVEGAQAISRRQAEVMRENVESVLKASRDMMTGGTPETNVSKQTELAKDMFEKTFNHLREISEMVTKSGFEAFDVLNRRAAETMEEIGSKTAGTVSKKKSA
jgi:phasin family protein